MDEKKNEKQNEKKIEPAKVEADKKAVDVKAFIARKLAVINLKTGANAENAAARVIENNKKGVRNNGTL